LDYLIEERKEYRVRRKQKHTLKKGDRVAVLGHGIAVVEQVDGNDVHVALGNRQILRVARIELNEQNMRWECGAKNGRGDNLRRYQGERLCEWDLCDSQHAHWTESRNAVG
jgi:preprotein translocase subunit YajC